MNYNALIHKLFNVNFFGGIKLGLDNVKKISKLLDHPESSFKSIHVAGTNGKGSVTKKIADGLIAAGYRVGHYTSPHISTFRERIRVNDLMITEKEVEEMLPVIFHHAEQHNIHPTFFEITTLLAFLYFSKKNVDFAVLETGLGGRLDATNIVTPVLSIITSISLEHTDILGDTIDQIAIEKAGIIKEGVPIVLGPHAQLGVIKEIAKHKKSPLITVSGHFNNFIEENTAIVKEALKFLNVPEKALTVGLKASLPCRFECFQHDGVEIILDVAHNPDGVQKLCDLIRSKYPSKPVRIVCGFSKNKDIHRCLSILSKISKNFHLVEANNGRAASTAYLGDILSNLNINFLCEPSVDEGIKHAIYSAKTNKEIVVVCGTFFIMSDARKAIGIIEPCDEIDLNERTVAKQ